MRIFPLHPRSAPAGLPGPQVHWALPRNRVWFACLLPAASKISILKQWAFSCGSCWLHGTSHRISHETWSCRQTQAPRSCTQKCGLLELIMSLVRPKAAASTKPSLTRLLTCVNLEDWLLGVRLLCPVWLPHEARRRKCRKSTKFAFSDLVAFVRILSSYHNGLWVKAMCLNSMPKS